MLIRLRSVARLVLPLAFCSGLIFAQAPPVPDQMPDETKAQLLQRLPPEWRAEVTRNHIFDEYKFRYTYATDSPDNFLAYYSEPQIKYQVISSLVETPGAQAFVLDHLSELSLDTRKLAYLWIGEDTKELWIYNPDFSSALEHAAVAETDPEASTAAFQALHMLEAHRLKNALEIRLQDPRFISTKQDGVASQAERDRLLKELRPLYLTMDGVTLPSFAIDPPEVFTVPSRSQNVRVAIIGDYGTMDEAHRDQKKVADAMITYHKHNPFDFGITVGDNFYFNMKSPHDELWKADFEDLYSPLGITFYPSFGNHDWDNPMASIEVLRSEASSHWHFPAQYYTYIAGPVQFFVINTGEDENLSLNVAQLDWLKSELLKSKAAWKVVYGHYPVKDAQRGYDWSVYKRLMPVLAGKADVYISGHMHSSEHLKPEAGVNLFVAGASGQASAWHEFDSLAFFTSGENAFAVLEADNNTLTMRFVNSDNKELYNTTLRK